MIDDMVVHRVENSRGSHIEPPLQEEWSDFEKLRWCAAVVFADCGVRITVTEGGLRIKRFGHWREVPGMYGYVARGSSGGSMGFDDMWSFLNGVATGANLVRRESVTS